MTSAQMIARPASPLARRIALQMMAALLLVAVLLVTAWGWVVRGALVDEHEQAATRIAALFEAGLHNAMLKRDLEGLSDLLGALGHLPGLRAAALMDRSGEVRFASEQRRIGADESAVIGGMCVTADCAPIAPQRLDWVQGADGSALRVVRPIANEARCAGCHGDPGVQPINGVLVLDFSPPATEARTWRRIGLELFPLSIVALMLFGLIIGWVLRRQVLAPVARLSSVVRRFAAGDLTARNAVAGTDELAGLGRGFDRMADELQARVGELSGQREFLQSLIDASPDGILVLAADGSIVMANSAYAKMIGVDPEHAIGQRCHRLGRGFEQRCPSTLVQCPLVECRADGSLLRTVMAMQRAGGEQFHVEIHAVALQGPTGERLVIEVIRELGEKIRFSQEQRLSAIGLLANGVAHEIHNPLASIRLALQACLRGVRDHSLDDRELTDYLQIVDEQIDRCVSITQRLMRLSQASATDAQPVSVERAVDDVLALLRLEAEVAKVELSAAIVPPDARVSMDEGELRQVLFNLVQNAIRAMPDGGSCIVSGERRGARYRIMVADTGVGIDPNLLESIFMPFFSRLPNGRRGSGLGLAICKSLIEQRSGGIEVFSTPGAGSRFVVELPDPDVFDADGLAPEAGDRERDDVGPRAEQAGETPVGSFER